MLKPVEVVEPMRIQTIDSPAPKLVSNKRSRPCLCAVDIQRLELTGARPKACKKPNLSIFWWVVDRSTTMEV